MSRELTVSFDPGEKGTRVAVILECPGQDEDRANPKHPAAGATGKNLRELLDKIRKGVKTEFSNHLHYDEAKPQSGVMVCNAHSVAYYNEGPNKFKPKAVSCQQVKFVGGKIKDKDMAICFGKDAVECYDRVCSCEASAKPKVGQIAIRCCHIGNKGLNRTLPTKLLQEIQTTEDNSRVARLSLVSQYVIAVINNDISAAVSFGKWLKCRVKLNCENKEVMVSRAMKLSGVKKVIRHESGGNLRCEKAQC